MLRQYDLIWAVKTLIWARNPSSYRGFGVVRAKCIVWFAWSMVSVDERSCRRVVHYGVLVAVSLSES